MLAGLDARQLSEMYAFARVEPLDQPLEQMLAQLTSVIAKVHGNNVSEADFLLRPDPAITAAAPATAEQDKAVRSQQIAQMFARAAKQNGKKAKRNKNQL